MPFMVTPLYAGLLGIVLLVLSFLVSRQRMRHKVSVGDGGVPALIGAIRAQGNFVEYVPLTLILLALLELTHHSIYLLHGLGIALVVGRVLHAYGLSNRPDGRSFGRMWGILLTWIPLLAASVLLIIAAVYHLLAA